jgi:hypothetical protein
MVDNYKIVCVTPAGRRRYMQYLIPFVVNSNIVDRYDIWINTTNKQDIEFFEILANKISKINLVYQPDGVINGNASINAFFRNCIEEDVIYFRLDDDIVWVEPNLFDKMVHFRIDNPEYFLVFPLIINNAICTYILQNTEKITLNKYYPARATDDILWGSGKFAAQLHNWFLTTQLPNMQYENLYSGKHPIAINRFSINCILWFGHEMKKFDGIVLNDEEEYLSVVKPTELGAVNCINGNAIISHFAFFTQRKKLDRLNVLERYGEYLHREWSQNTTMHAIDQTVQSAMNEVEERKTEIIAKPSIYSLSSKKGLKTRVLKWKLPLLKFYTLGQIKNMLLNKKEKTYII